jgi:hypothetical protein
VHQSKKSQWAKHTSFCQARRAAGLQRQGDSHAEEGQAVDEKDQNDIEMHTGKLLSTALLNGFILQQSLKTVPATIVTFVTLSIGHSP